MGNKIINYLKEFVEDHFGCQFDNLKDLWYWEDKKIDEDTYYLLSDFKNFVKVCFYYLELPSPTKWQLDFCDDLQYGSLRSIKMCYRGFGKSYISCLFIIWNLYRDPNIKSLIISVAEDKAAENSNFIKNVISIVPFLNYLEGKSSRNSKINKRSSSLAFDVAPCKVEQAPSVRAVGITGRITGSRADIILFDDVESIENSTSHKKREYVLHKCMVEGESILKENDKSRICYIGTPQTFQSLYFKIIGFDIKIWPLRYPNKDQYNKYFINYANDTMRKEIEEHPELLDIGFGYHSSRSPVCDPKRYSEEVACEKEFRQGGSNFDLQYMLYTHSSDKNKFKLKLKDLIVDDLDQKRASSYYTWGNDDRLILDDLPINSLMDDCYYSPIFKDDKYSEFETTRMYIDVSGKGKDEMAYVVLKALNGNIFLVDVGGVSNYENENLIKLANVAKRFKVNDIICEDNYADGMFRNLLQPVINKIYPTSISGFKVGNKTNKETRVNQILLPLFESHRIIVDKNTIIADSLNLPEVDGNYEKRIQYSLFYQICRLTEEKGCLAHDDRIDIFASGCKDLIDFIDRDPEEEAKRTKKEDLKLSDLLSLYDDENDIENLSWV